MPERLPPLPEDWRARLTDSVCRDALRRVRSLLAEEDAAGHVVLPVRPDTFRALELTPWKDIKVVLLGQDPYPTPGHAHGLCFSVRPDVKPLPGSLRNIFKELHSDLDVRIPNHGSLEAWARQGVLLLNTVLTVRAHAANSHRHRGWEEFTDRIIARVAEKTERVVFVLWGRQAEEKRELIRASQHRVVVCAHPSPLSARRFFGCRCFSAVNRHLTDAGRPPVDWRIPDREE